MTVGILGLGLIGGSLARAYSMEGHRVLCADQDNVFAVSRLARLASHVHLKDFVKIDFYSDEDKTHCFNTRGGNFLRGTAVGYGAAKTAQCLTILKNVGYDGYVDIEFEGPEDCVAELEKGLAFYKSC